MHEHQDESEYAARTKARFTKNELIAMLLGGLAGWVLSIPLVFLLHYLFPVSETVSVGAFLRSMVGFALSGGVSLVAGFLSLKKVRALID